MLKAIAIMVFIFIVIPSILASLLWSTGIGVVMHGLLIGFCYLFASGKTAVIIGTILYWLPFFFIVLIVFLSLPKKEELKK